LGTGQGFNIRFASSEDAENISLLYKKVWNDYTGIFPENLKAARQPSTIEMVQWLQKDSYIVATKNDKLVGVVGIAFKHGACLLMHMVVDKNSRRIGIGSALVEKAIAYAKKNGATKVWLDTVPILKEAIALYTKYGFKKCGYLKKHYWGADIELYELLL
jgi:ribosomal protein S18 acetylase RimI-like enzyme